MPTSANAKVSPPFFQPDEKFHRRRIADWALWANQGHLANVGTVTLGTGTVATVVADSRVSFQSVPILQPSTQNAASAQATTFVSTVSAGGFTITHASGGSADRAYRYALLG